MNRRVIVGSFVVLAVALVLWLKPSRSVNGTHEVQDPASAATRVLLFADPREAESSCGCGQIIRMVRGADVPGVRGRPGVRPAARVRSSPSACRAGQPQR